MNCNIKDHEVKPELLKLRMESICVYRNLLKDNIVNKFCTLIHSISTDFNLTKFIKSYNEFFFCLIKLNKRASFKEYIFNCVLFDENPYSRNSGEENFLRNSVINDLQIIEYIANIKPQKIKEYIIKNFLVESDEIGIVSSLPEWGEEFADSLKESNYDNNKINLRELKFDIDKLDAFYKSNGTGIFAKYKAFIWENSELHKGVRGIDSPDPIRFSDLIGYEEQRSEIIDNTIMFLKGYPANNILLYGDRGTGKSSTVKALLNEYHDSGLRLIEVPKSCLINFPEIINILRERDQKFILFVDDLAFEDNEENYTALKAILEGGVESKPQNVIIYATSNRRHLIKEKFSDRLGFQSDNHEDEIRAADTMQEKLSLADRFGMTIVFSSPDKKRYLEIVEGLAKKRNLNIDLNELQKEALKWELWYNGRSPRTARQFVDWLQGKMGI